MLKTGRLQKDENDLVSTRWGVCLHSVSRVVIFCKNIQEKVGGTKTPHCCQDINASLLDVAIIKLSFPKTV